MKCPVCDEKLENTAKKCSKCGFADLRTEFLNEIELNMWQTYVVYPCQFAYQTSIAQRKELEKTIQETLATIKKNYTESSGVAETSNNGSPSFKELPINKSDAWITTGNIEHKSFYECSRGTWTKCEISNLTLKVVGNKATVNFLVKKVYDYEGPTGVSRTAFKWKLKDDYGLVVADGYWSNDNLNVGDVTNGTFTISGLDPSIKYVLELINGA